MSEVEPSAVICAGVVVADHLCTPIDHLPVAGELVKAEKLVVKIGGCATNAAVDLARLGCKPTVCGRVGADMFGRFVAEVLEQSGVDSTGLSVDPSLDTSQTLIVNVKGQDRRFIHSFGANAGLSAADVAAALTPSTRVLYLGGYLILPGIDPEALAGVFREARNRGIFTVLDVVVPGPGPHLEALRPILAETDAFLPNTDEARIILGESDPIRQAEAFHKMGARRVVVTRGEHGSIAISDTLRASLGAFPVEFVDGTGGGDAFDAGYIAGLLEGLDEIGCLTLASAVGASCVRAVGATDGVFNRAEARDFIARHPLKIEHLGQTAR